MSVSTAAQVISFTYLNSFLEESTRTTVLSIYYACEAVFVVIVMRLNSILLKTLSLGYSWLILLVVGIVLMLIFSVQVIKAEKYSIE